MIFDGFRKICELTRFKRLHMYSILSIPDVFTLCLFFFVLGINFVWLHYMYSALYLVPDSVIADEITFSVSYVILQFNLNISYPSGI